MAASPQLTLADQRTLVLAAITRIRHFESAWRDKEADPTSSSEQRRMAKMQFHKAEEEFGWQWRNVLALLEHYRATAL